VEDESLTKCHGNKTGTGSLKKGHLVCTFGEKRIVFHLFLFYHDV
jgi:hypothetical protein